MNKKTERSKTHLRASDICRMLGVSDVTGWRWRKQGLWVPRPPIRIGGLTVWTVADVNEWLESRRANV